jgi:hypothetical protein
MRQHDKRLLESVNLEDLLWPILEGLDGIFKGWTEEEVKDFAQSLGDLQLNEPLFPLAEGLNDLLMNDEGFSQALGEIFAEDTIIQALCEITGAIGGGYGPAKSRKLTDAQR